MVPPDEALRRVRERIGSACARAGREPGGVRLVAVSKTVPVERIRAVMACGHALFGENRVQEALGKIAAIGPEARWHLVGSLQKNKARHAVEAFDLIHSVDGEALAAEIDRRAGRIGKKQEVLVQINLAGETTKHGLPESAADAVLSAMRRLAHVEVRGLMIIPPPVEDPERARPWFARLRALRDRLRASSGLDLPELSMGMSDDFEVAVEEGATLVRVGRALFGERTLPLQETG
jgi:pyridoxal phosphate enzyme (YggS family)